MNEIFKLALSLSLSGSVLAAGVFVCCRLLCGRLSKRFQYYIWLIVVLRLILPFSPESALVPRLWEPAPPAQVEPAAITTPQARSEPALTTPSPAEAQPGPAEASAEAAGPQTARQGSSIIPALQTLWRYLWILWLAVAAGLIIRKITLYQSFVKYLRAGRAEVDDIETLDRFAALSEQMGVRRTIDLYTNRLTASPLILGFRRVAVVLPEIPDNEQEFRLICLHELTHYKRRDIWYKWLLQVVLCLHWFNPVVHWVVREVNRLCELSCDEAVLRALEADEYRLYGDTLLKSLQTPGTYREGLAALTLHESARSLKERLDSIMKFTGPNKAAAVLAVALALLLFTGGYALGAYSVQPQEVTLAENVGFSPEGLPIMSAKNREVYEAYVQQVAVTGLLRVDFTPEDPSALVANGGDIMRNMYNVLLNAPLTDIPEAIPASEVEQLLMAKLDVNHAAIRNAFADYYDEATDTYELYGGLGGGPAIPVVTGGSRQGDLLTVNYTWYIGDPSEDIFRYAKDEEGTLVIRLTDDDFQYVSNKVTPINDNDTPQEQVSYVTQQNRSIEENIILLAVQANLSHYSWSTPEEIEPDNLFEYYEAMVIYGETEKLAGEYVPAETAIRIIQRHFDVDAGHLKQSGYYDRERDAFYVGGLGNVLDFTVEGSAAEGGNTVITYAIYFRDELQSQCEMTVIIADGGYKYLSNRIITDERT